MFKHFIYRGAVVDRALVDELPVHELGLVAPVTCQVLADRFFITCEHAELEA